jgi:hypothetical protein
VTGAGQYSHVWLDMRPAGSFGDTARQHAASRAGIVCIDL